jgi:exodeoxyribonuclease-5
MKNNNPRKIFDCREEQIDYTMDQKKALLLVDTFMQSKETFLLIAGNAGTGKTTIAENIANFCSADILAPTNAAVKRLRDRMFGSGITKNRFSTIHQQLYGSPNPDTGEFVMAGNLKGAPTYLIDESSMIDVDVLKDLMDEAKKAGVRIIFLGDDFQLEPVGKDPKLFGWQKSFPNDFNDNYKFKLTEVRRNEGAILEVATHLRGCKGSKVEVLNRDTQDFIITRIFTHELALDIRDDRSFVVLVSTNKTRIAYNKRIRQAKYEEDCVNVVNDGEKVISVANNEYLNGEHYTIKNPKIIKSYDKTVNLGSKMYPKKKRLKFYLVEHEVEGHDKTFKTLLFPDLDVPSLHSGQIMNNREIFMDNNLVKYHKMLNRRLWRKNLNIATYGYATSTHKSQGNEWDNVYIDCDWLSDNWNKARWLYTAITRAKKKVELKFSNQFKVID